jgi:hypothetical protein
MYLFDLNEFEISAQQCPAHYSPARNGDMLDIVVQQNIRLSDIIVSDILDSDHPPIAFHRLGHAKIRNNSEPTEKFTDWNRFQRLASELITPKIEIYWKLKPIKRLATLQPLLLRHIGCRQVKLHFRA